MSVSGLPVGVVVEDSFKATLAGTWGLSDTATYYSTSVSYFSCVKGKRRIHLLHILEK
jgi:hypothetical protein